MQMQGRRISARSRYRTGNLMDDDGTVDAAVDPDDPGVSTDGETAGGETGISIGIGISL